MKKGKAILGIGLVVLIGIGVISSCEKKENLVPNDNNSSMQKQQKWDPDKDSYLILKEDDAPFQYAVYQKDENNLSHYIQLSFDSKEKGYFIFSSNTANDLIYYGFITESSRYYDPNIFIDNSDHFDDSGGIKCFAIIRKEFDNFKEGWSYLMEKVKEGYQVSIAIDKKTKMYVVSYDDGK